MDDRDRKIEAFGHTIGALRREVAAHQQEAGELRKLIRIAASDPAAVRVMLKAAKEAGHE